MSLELTKENINAVSLELVKNKKMFDKNVNYVMGFMLKSFPEKNELLSRIKVLNIKSRSAKKIDPESDVMEQIAMNVFAIKNLDEGSFTKNMLALFRDPSSFSQAFLTYFYSNLNLSTTKTDEILNGLVELLLSESKLKKSFMNFMNSIELSEDSESISLEEAKSLHKASDDHTFEKIINKESYDESSSTVMSLVSLDDSEEIKRIDTSISLLFEGKREKMSMLSILVCTRVLNIIRIILENNYPRDVDVIPVLMYIAEIDQTIFKKSMSAIKIILRKTDYRDKEKLFEMFCALLERNPGIIRMAMLFVDTCGKHFNWPRFLEIIDGNEEIDLDVVDRSYIPNSSFYEFILFAEDPRRYMKTIKSMIRNELDSSLLRDLKEKINGRPDLKDIKPIKDAISSRLKLLSQKKCSKKERKDNSN
ncbi:hypothetical protein P7C64_10s4g17840 [Encephalitozoon intestinalis]